MFKLKTKRILSGIMSFAVTASILTYFPAFADEQTEPEKYPYTMFAASNFEGAITINADNVCINGSIAANGTIVSTSSNFNVNGAKTENADEEMIYIQKKLNYSYFSGDNVEMYADDYTLEDQNININNPMNVNGTLEMTGNINLNSGIKALEDVSLNGEVKNTNNSVIFSETGDININTNNTNFSGLIYAPYGDIVIDTDNLNLNNVVIIGQTITLDCPSINANYSTYAAELIGTESDIDVELYAMGEYNSEANSIDIEWYTNYSNSNYEIWISDDNAEYTSVGVVSKKTTYQYPITEDFEKRYFKISLTTNYGEYIESIPFIVTKDENGYTVDFLDSDEDDLPDVFEISLGTNINDVDSDKDGLTDYQEVYITGTDPTKYDSVTEGVSDAYADSDGDGLSNAQEIELGTDPLLSDTDDDNLYDYDELYVYGTDPLNPDTDGDGLEDGDELHIGLHPTTPETFGIPDAEYKVEQTISADSGVLSEINTAENAYELSIDMKTNGYAAKEVIVSKSSYSYAIENDAMIGLSADISISDTCNPEEIVLKYNIKEAYIDNTLNLYSSLEEFQGIKRLNVFKFDEDKNMLLPVDTKFDAENGLLYAEVDELGTYCIMDMEIWLNILGIVPEIESKEQSYTLFDSEIQDNTFSIDNQTSFKKYFFKNKTYALYEETGLSWEEAKRYCESLGGHLVTITSPEEQNFINNILSGSYNNLYWIGAKKVDNRWSWVTGEPFVYVNWAKNEPSPQTNENYVHIYAKINSSSINKGEWNNTVSFYNGVHSFYDTSNCGFICEWEDNQNIPHEYCIIVPTKWKKISLNGELNPNNNIDTDGDTLTDWEEVDTARLIWNEDGSFDIPTFNISEIINHINRYQSPDYNFLFDDMKNNNPHYYLPILSDPTEADSDGDGILDSDEYINLTSDSRYDNIDPLKADTVETLYPELTRNSKTNVDTNPIYIVINNNTITLKVKYKLNNKAYELSNIIKPNSTEYYTNEEIIMKSIEDKWNIEIQGDVFDFYPGMSIKVKIELQGVTGGKYIEFIIGDDGNNSTSFEGNIWNTNKIKYVKLSTKKGDGKYLDEVNRFAAPPHELGHTLGLTDVYGYNNNIDWRLQPVIYDISKTTQNEIWYKNSAKNPDGDLMYSFGLVRANDIEMILQAYCDNQKQYFKPEFDKKNEVSKAIKQTQNNIYLDRMNKEFVIYDSVSKTTTSIGGAYAYQKFLKDNYGINVTITELEEVYGKNNITS